MSTNYSRKDRAKMEAIKLIQDPDAEVDPKLIRDYILDLQAEIKDMLRNDLERLRVENLAAQHQSLIDACQMQDLLRPRPTGIFPGAECMCTYQYFSNR